MDDHRDLFWAIFAAGLAALLLASIFQAALSILIGGSDLREIAFIVVAIIALVAVAAVRRALDR